MVARFGVNVSAMAAFRGVAPKALAMPGVLTAINAAMRPLGAGTAGTAGTAGIETGPAGLTVFRRAAAPPRRRAARKARFQAPAEQDAT